MEKDTNLMANFLAAREAVVRQRTRAWFTREQRKPVHPVVVHALSSGHRPKDWQQLLLEWPHLASDGARVAYTRDEMKGEQDIQTVTSVGKYMARHWPHIPDHTLRDWCALFTPDTFEVVDTMEQIIMGIELGPRSCMQSGYGSIPFNSEDHAEMLNYISGDADKEAVPWEKHPYAMYSPQFGWRMALRRSNGRIDGRALVLHDGDDKYFVRTYTRNLSDNGAMSAADTALDAWLKDKGYVKRSSWPEGTKLAKVRHPKYGYGYMMPYIDGNVQCVGESTYFFMIDDEGCYQCDNTDGTMSEANRTTCDACGDSVSEEDVTYVGANEDRCVCQHCLDSHYTWVLGPRTRETYYVRDTQAVEVNGEWYDGENLPDYIVELHDGDYEHMRNAVWVESAGEYYRYDDDAVCCTDDSEWELREDCVKCADGEWRLESDCVEVNGEWYEEGTEPESEETETAEVVATTQGE